MIELKQNRLNFSFPEVSPDARLTIEFQRTLRIPDDDQTYPLPPGLGKFPLEHVDDYASRVPERWVQRGGVMLPMYQAEALWINFNFHYVQDRESPYPFAVKISAGKIDAVTGENWDEQLHRKPQDYVVIPRQPWLDGYCIRRGVIRQFVAMPLGAGYSAEEQITGEAEHGGLQIKVFPMRRKAFERRFPVVRKRRMMRSRRCFPEEAPLEALFARKVDSMALAPGGQMSQEIYDDEFPFHEWCHKTSSRCFVHLVNTEVWRGITGKKPPTKPPKARDYTNAGLPWFDYYDERPAVPGQEKLSNLQSVAELAEEKRQNVLPENDPVDPQNVVGLRKGMRLGQVREGCF
ncbi:MAG: hypothetical protein MPJ50_09270 [Pirellulales bacterium]|nr:hypothetical protein [Pirellulales bacterium]